MKGKYEDLSEDSKEMMDIVLDITSLLKKTSANFATREKSFNVVACLIPVNNIKVDENEEEISYRKEKIPSIVVSIKESEKESIVEGLYNMFTSDRIMLSILTDVAKKMNENKDEIVEKLKV